MKTIGVKFSEVDPECRRPHESPQQAKTFDFGGAAGAATEGLKIGKSWKVEGRGNMESLM